MRRSSILAAVAASTLMLAACGANSDSADNQAASDDTMTAANGVAAVPAEKDMAAPAATTMDGQGFANAAAASDAFEIASSKLAQTKAQSAEVKQFAAEMIQAHTQSTAKLKAASGQATPAITPTPAMDAEQQASMATLEGASGAAFDSAYATAQTAAHQKTLATLQAYAASGDVPSLKSFAGETAPVVQHHLEMAEKLPK